MGILGFPFLRDFRDPVVIIGTPISTQTTDNTDGAYNTVNTVNMSGAECPKYTVANSGSRDHILGQMEDSSLEIEYRGISKSWTLTCKVLVGDSHLHSCYLQLYFHY